MQLNTKLIIAILLIIQNIYSQKSSEYDYGIPLPPESYQFKKSLLNNVSLYTGQPSIDIPIYSINLDGLEVPISISYNTGGIKVEEDATSVGLGWSLNIGGQITRNNHGAPDERYFIHEDYNNKNTFGIGRLKTSIDPIEVTEFDCGGPNLEYGSRAQFYGKAFLAGNDKRSIYGNEDSRPDEFYYSFFGHSGKFMFSQEQRKFITFPLDDINISYELGKLSTIPMNYFFDNFNIKLPNGYNLILGKDGTTSISQYGLTPFDQSWQLKRIISPRKKEITYNYISANYNLFTNLSNETSKTATGYKGFNDLVIVTSTQWNVTSTKEKLISEIIFPEGKINFIYGNRMDLQTGAKKLEKIEIYNNENSLIRKIELVQSYFDANIHLYHQGEVNKRLKLDALKFYDSKNTAIENYSFNYYLLDKIPSKSSKAQDHWGYFNGKETNESLFPEYILPFHNVESSRGFNRDLDTIYTKTFSLKSIKFPEGGIKYYDYENHKCLTGSTTGNYFDAISDERYEVKTPSFTVSGYNLNYFYPTANESNSFKKVFYSDPIEATIYSSSLKENQVSVNIYSNFPFQVPNYKSINTEFNKIEFYLQKKQEDGIYKDIAYYGTISKDENTSGIIKDFFKIGGKGSYRMKIIIIQSYLLSDSKDYNFYHNSSITIGYRDKVRDDVHVGGLRIKGIQTYTDETLNTVKYTSYFKYLDDNNITSGKMMNVPSYIENISYYTPWGANDKSSRIDLGIRMSSTSTLSLYKTSGSNVGYTKVSQINYDNINKKEIKEDHYFSFKEPLFSELTLFDDLREDEPQEWHRGKLIRKLFYNNKDIVKEELFDYYGKEVEKDRGYVDEINYELLDQNELCNNAGEERLSKHIYPSISLIDVSTFPSDLKNFLTGLERYPINKYAIENYNPTGLKIPYFKIYTGFDKLKSKTVRNYFKDGIVEEKEEYRYNNLPNNIELTSVKSTTSKNNETLETKYFYPHDSEMANEPFVNDLVSSNRIGTPLKTQIFKGEAKLSEEKTIFDKSSETSNLLLPKYTLKNKGTTDLNFVTDKIISFDKYDNKGNILQYTPEAGLPVSMIWGYNKTQPIAKIENAAYDQIVNYVSNLQNLSDEDNDNCATSSCKEQILRNALNTLRTSLPQAMISTYTYDPLIGVTSITDAKGISVYYEYDSFGRLKFVKDHNLNVLNSYCYNYKGQTIDCSVAASVVYQSVKKSGVYGKNDCPVGSVSYLTTYTVPAQKYTSAISQEDADAKAQNDVDSNGQVFANTTLQCYFKNKKISKQFTKNDCQGDALPPENTYHIIEEGIYGSTVSQEAADALAQGEMDKYGQLYVNQNNECIYKNKALSKLFTKNDCSANSGPQDAMLYNVEAGKFISIYSQADADAQALEDLNTNGQNYVNSNSNCAVLYKNQFVSGFFSKNDCAIGGIPAQQIFGIPEGQYTSTISQADADAKAKAGLAIRGQEYANEYGYCTFKNKEICGYFQMTRCPDYLWGDYMEFCVPAGTISGNSQESADRGAQSYIDIYGQEYVDTHGSCISFN